MNIMEVNIYKGHLERKNYSTLRDQIEKEYRTTLLHASSVQSVCSKLFPHLNASNGPNQSKQSTNLSRTFICCL